MFNPDEMKYANGVLVELPYPTDDMRCVTDSSLLSAGKGPLCKSSSSVAACLAVLLRRGVERLFADESGSSRRRLLHDVKGENR